MLIYLVIAPILFAVLLYLFPTSKISKSIVIVAQALLVAAAFVLFYQSRTNEISLNIGDYGGFLGITLAVDQLSAIFLILTVVIFFALTIYNIGENNSKFFWFLLFLLEGTLIGLFLTRDIFNIFVLAEVTTVLGAIFLMYHRIRRSMYDGLVYLMVNVIVMQFYLFGIGFLYMLTGVLDMDQSALVIATTLDNSQLTLPFALIKTAIAAKCSLLPLMTFLPKVHSIPDAPSSVGTILSCLQVKAGIYLFLRFRHIFQGIDASSFFLILGIITAVFGIILALGQTNIKSILAYSTIAQVGLIVIGLSLEGTYSYIGSLYHVFSHAIAKATLFLSAGIIMRVYDTLEMSKIKGVLKEIPVVGFVTILAILSMTGAPLFSGNISKYFMMSEANFIIYPIIILINLGTITVFIKYATILFGKMPAVTEEEIDEAKATGVLQEDRDNIERTGFFAKAEAIILRIDIFKEIAVVLLAILCLLGGIFGTELIGLLFHYDVVIRFADIAEKAIIFVCSWGAGYFIYRFAVKKNASLKFIGHLDLNFRTICVSIGGFFALTLLVVGVVLS
ncbi:MAG: proton-conducting membrane transporter [Lachnospiraceae bacterium]|nr:proton-conducting membrane transporter [Lachnospiraceae bacterium]